MTTTTLLIATHNRGKLAELADLLPGLPIACVGLADAGLTAEVAETGATFHENAVLKAKGYAAASGLLTLADDSGLEVDALHGQPGVHTARFGGPGLSAEQRYRLLLQSLTDVPWEQRTARFHCVVALARPAGLIATAEGVCEGVIAFEPAGAGGFGYDPVFYLPEYGCTLAQLPPAEKRQISHRGRAGAAIKPMLQLFLSQIS